MWTVLLCLAWTVTCARTDLFERLRKEEPRPSQVDQVRWYVMQGLQDLRHDVSESNDVNQDTVQDVQLLRAFLVFNDNFTIVSNLTDTSGFYYISGVWSYAQVQSEIDNIQGYFETFLRFQNDHFSSDGIKKPPRAWLDLAETYLQTTDIGLTKSMEKLHRYAATKIESATMFHKVLKDMQGSVCNLPQSTHQLLYNLYNQVALAQLKGYTMIQFSYMLLKLYNKGNFTLEAQLARTKFEERTMEEINAVREAMADADRSVYSCDPKQFVEGSNYVKLTKLLQGYVENEVNLNRYGTCRENCGYYYYTQYNGCYKDQFCAKQTQCSGNVVECRYIDSDMNICKSSDPDRRYDWVEYENGRVLGTKGVCEKRSMYKVDSWWRYLFWHCSYCFCLCDDNHASSDRYFNLREVNADIQNNKVVTGLRIIKKNQIIHLQIEEGPLGPRGVVNKSLTSWKDVEDYRVDDHDVEDGKDYHTMTWKDRALDIDSVMCNADHVVTGVRFRKIGAHLNLEVRATPINFTTGEVFKNEYSYWEGNDNTEASASSPRSEIKLDNPDIPIRRRENVVDSRPDQFVLFQATSIDTDAAQNTVPYLDSQPLTSHGFPLGGLGLVHRGKHGSGGFVAPQLISYDFSRHLIAEFPAPE